MIVMHHIYCHARMHSKCINIVNLSSFDKILYLEFICTMALNTTRCVSSWPVFWVLGCYMFEKKTATMWGTSWLHTERTFQACLSIFINFSLKMKSQNGGKKKLITFKLKPFHILLVKYTCKKIKCAMFF